MNYPDLNSCIAPGPLAYEDIAAAWEVCTAGMRHVVPDSQEDYADEIDAMGRWIVDGRMYLDDMVREVVCATGHLTALVTGGSGCDARAMLARYSEYGGGQGPVTVGMIVYQIDQRPDWCDDAGWSLREIFAAAISCEATILIRACWERAKELQEGDTAAAAEQAEHRRRKLRFVGDADDS